MATARVAYSGRFLYGHMSSHVTFAVPVGVGVVWRRVGTLASPSVPEPPHADETPSWPGRRKRPHSTQHRSRPYADDTPFSNHLTKTLPLRSARIAPTIPLIISSV